MFSVVFPPGKWKINCNIFQYNHSLIFNLLLMALLETVVLFIIVIEIWSFLSHDLFFSFLKKSWVIHIPHITFMKTTTMICQTDLASRGLIQLTEFYIFQKTSYFGDMQMQPEFWSQNCWDEERLLKAGRPSLASASNVKLMRIRSRWNYVLLCWEYPDTH